MRTNFLILFAGALLSLPVFSADTSSVDSPMMGYVVRPEATPQMNVGPELRAMLGIPGAARFSDPLPLPDSTVAAEVAPGHAWVLVIRAADALAYIPASQLSTPLPGGGVPQAWAFSPSGSRMALSYPDRGEIVLLSGLPGNPKIEKTLAIAAFDSFAAGDNGTLVYSSGNQLFTGDGQFLYGSDRLGAMSFAAARDSIILFDSAIASLVEVGVLNASSRVVATGLAAAPDTLFAGADRIYAGNTAAGTVSLIEYADGSIASQNVNVSRIAPSAIAGTMLVSFDWNGPAWLIGVQGVSFVPAIVKQSVQ
jgi:hypothetical protein